MKKVISRTGLIVVLLAAPLVSMVAEAAPTTKTKKPVRSKGPANETAEPAATINPAVFLIRDPLVVAELQLTSKQTAALADLADESNEPVWKLRDLAPEAATGSEEVKRFNAAFEPKLAEILSATQGERMNQIVLRMQGPEALGRARVGDRLGLAHDQRQAIGKLLAEARGALEKVRVQSRAGKNLPELKRQAEKLRAALQTDLLAALTPAQRSRWDALLGKPFDLSKLGPLSAQAPELRDVEAWLNTEPLTLEKLRGQVVALHFWTFG